jgi:hypothetical protein
VLLAHGRAAVAAARLEELYGLLTAAGTGEAGEASEESSAVTPVAVSGETRMVPGGTLYHRADCPLVAGKARALPVDGRLLAAGGLGPCPVCEPGAPDPAAG